MGLRLPRAEDFAILQKCFLKTQDMASVHRAQGHFMRPVFMAGFHTVLVLWRCFRKLNLTWWPEAEAGHWATGKVSSMLGSKILVGPLQDTQTVAA